MSRCVERVEAMTLEADGIGRERRRDTPGQSHPVS
jgi:hypothetical protein